MMRSFPWSILVAPTSSPQEATFWADSVPSHVWVCSCSMCSLGQPLGLSSANKWICEGILVKLGSFLKVLRKQKGPSATVHWRIFTFKRNREDGRVEGRALTPSCESTGIPNNYWTNINRKTLELTKIDTPHPKTKEKPQWDSRRGAITIKSNPITTGGVTHKLENNYTTKSTYWSEGSEPHIRLPNLGVWQREEELPENQTLKASRIWLQDFDRTGGNRDSTLGGHTQSSVHLRTQEEGAVTP